MVRRSSAGGGHPEGPNNISGPRTPAERTDGTGFNPGIVERLTSWCTLHERGLARVEWDSVFSRQEVVNRLKFALGESGIPVVEFEAPHVIDPMSFKGFRALTVLTLRTFRQNFARNSHAEKSQNRPSYSRRRKGPGSLRSLPLTSCCRS